MKYSSKLRSRQALGLKRLTFAKFALSGAMRSLTSSHTNTFRTRLPHFFKKTFATSRIARLSSIDLYWSTQLIPVVDGAISEVIRSNCPIPRESRKVLIFSYSKILSWRRWMFHLPKLGSILVISIPTTLCSRSTIFPITWRKLPGAAHTSSTFIWGWIRLYFSWSSINLNALRARYPSFFAFAKYGSWTMNCLVMSWLTDNEFSIHWR